MNGNDNYDEYNEDLDWDTWVDEAFRDYKNRQDPFAPVKGSSNHLPAKIPKSKKIRKTNTSKRYQIPIDWDSQPVDKAKKMKEEMQKLREEKMLRRIEQAKKISWKTIKKGDEYEVLVDGSSLGKVKRTLAGKWKIFPNFPWKRNSYNRQIIVGEDYQDFLDSGKALVDLWTVS